MIGRLLACCLIGLVATAGNQTWSLAESGSIRVITDDSPAVAAALLDELGAMQSMLRPLAAIEATLPLHVIALKDQQSFTELAPQRLRRGDIHTFGFSHTGPHTAFIALRTDRPASVMVDTLRHEYAHVLTAAASPDAPAWLDEGLAEFWSAIVVDGDRVVAGRTVAKHLELLRKQKWLPMDAMLKQPRGSLPSNPDHVALFYAQSWAMVHYLLLGQDANGPTKFMPAIAVLPAQFDSTVRQYVDEGRFREAVVPWQRPVGARGSASTIAESRALAERANLLVSGEQPRRALSVARKALSLDPNEPIALEATGTYYFLNNQPEQARAFLTRAFATGTSSYAVAIYLALLSSSPLDRERYLVAAIHLRPDSDLAWQRLTTILDEDGRLRTARRWCREWSTSRLSWLWLGHSMPCGS